MLNNIFEEAGKIVKLFADEILTSLQYPPKA